MHSIFCVLMHSNTFCVLMHSVFWMLIHLITIMITITHLTMTCRNVSNSNSSWSSPWANSSASSSSLSFSHVRLARIKCRVAMPIATCRHADTVNRTPKCFWLMRLNSRLNSSPAHGPRMSPNKYSDSRRSNGNARANGLTYTKYWTNTWLNWSGKHRTMYSVFPRRLRALSYMVKKHMRPLMTYMLRAEYMLLLILMDPNSGPRAGWPPIDC